MLFRYKGFDAAGKMYDGYVIANSKREALTSLKIDKDIVALVSIKRKIDNPIVNSARDYTTNQKHKMIQKINDTNQNKKEKQIIKREKIRSGEVKTFSISDTVKSARRKFLRKLLIDKDKPYKKVDTSGVSYIENDDQFGADIDYLADESYFLLDKANRGKENHFEDGASIDWDELIPQEQTIEIKKNMKIKIKETEVLLFTKKLNMMLGAGVPLMRALTILRDSSSKKLQKIINSIMESIRKGSPLSLSMSRFPKQFDSMYISLVSIGETSGSLTKALNDIVYYKEKSMKIRKKMKSASIYPTVIAIVLGILLVLGSIYFIPMFEEMFLSQNVKLPTITVIVFSIANKLPFIIGFIFFLTFLISILKKTSRVFRMAFKSFTDLLLFKLPVVKNVINASYMFSFTSATALMLENGIRLRDALQLTKRLMKNVYLKYQISSAIDLMVKGYSFSESISNQSYFDPLLVSILITGEESGRMSESLREIAEYYDEELSKQVGTLMEVIQPVFILLIAVFVVPVILAVYLPIMEISSGAVLGM